MTTPDPSTEQKIKEAARELFHQKGFDGTKTRDIAESSGINIALMNYYFRSKKKLFDLIMLETVETFFESVFDILWDDLTTLDEKISILSTHYIDMLQNEPDMPIFILSELRNNPGDFLGKVFQGKQILTAPFFRQLKEKFGDSKIESVHPGHFLLNFISLNVFPFVARPVIQELFQLDKEQFHDMLEERKQLIPLWVMQLTRPLSDLPNKDIP